MSAYRAIFWSFLTQYALFGMSFVVSVVLARLLGPHEMGIFSVAVALTILLQDVQGFSLNQFIVREADLRPAHLRTAFGISITISAIFSVALLIGAAPIAEFYGEPKIEMVLYILVLANLLFPIGLPAQALLMREMRYRDLFVINITAVTVAAAIGIWLAATQGIGALAQAWYVLVVAVVKSSLLLLYKPEHIRLRPSLEKWRAMTGFGSRMLGLSLTGSAMARGPDLIIGRLVNMVSVGLYSRASGITEQAFRLLYPGGGGALFSLLAQRRNAGRDLTDPYFKAVAYFTATIFPAFFALALMAEPVIMLLYGQSWLEAARILQWLCLSQAIMSAAVTHYEMPVVMGRLDLLLASEATHLSLGLSIFVAMTWFWGIEGAAAGRVAHALIFVSVNLIVLRKLLGFPLRRLFSTLLRCMVAAAVTGLPALVVRLAYHSAPEQIPFGVMVGTALLTGAAWLLGLKVAGHPLYHEVRGWMRGRLAAFQAAMR